MGGLEPVQPDGGGSVNAAANRTAVIEASLRLRSSHRKCTGPMAYERSNHKLSARYPYLTVRASPLGKLGEQYDPLDVSVVKLPSRVLLPRIE